MIQKVLSFARQHHMIEAGDHILTGVSGGADSVCLLHMLVRFRNIIGYTITVAHVEHGIRGEDSHRDAAFVKKLCEQLDVACYVYHCDAVAFSKERGMSLEEGARELRYGYFRRLKEQISANKIAVAHNQNDCAETVLFHLARGTGLRGLCGIVPVRDDIIRPLLCSSREEIEAYLNQEKQDFCVDNTNLEVAYSRNKIRHLVLPVLQEINSEAVKHLYQSTEYMAETVELVAQMVEKARETRVLIKKPESEYMLTKELRDENSLVQKSLVLELLSECAGSRKDISKVHVMQVLELFDHQVGRKIMLPYGIYAKRTYDGVIIGEFSSSKECPFREKAEFDFDVSGRVFERTEEIQEIPQKTYTKWFDYDKIKGGLELRKRCPGDYFVIDCQGRKQSLNRYFINEKVPAARREQVPVLADGSHILWAIGYRISEGYKVTNDTKRILEVQVNGGSTHE